MRETIPFMYLESFRLCVQSLVSPEKPAHVILGAWAHTDMSLIVPSSIGLRETF